MHPVDEHVFCPVLLFFMHICFICDTHSFYFCTFFIELFLFSLSAFVPCFFVQCSIFCSMSQHCFLSPFHHVENLICHPFIFSSLSIFLWDDLLSDVTKASLSVSQCRFVKDIETRNAIFMLRMLSERAEQMQKDVHLCFIDYTKEFDKVYHTDMLELLSNLDIFGKDIRIIKNLY